MHAPNDYAPQQLGRRSAVSREQLADPRSILDTFANPRPGRDYEIRFVFPSSRASAP